MASAVTVLLLTVSVALAVTLLLDFAVIVAVPSATPVANPELLIVATLVCEEVQVTCEVTSPVLLSPKVAVAPYCSVACGMMKAPVGETERETIVFLEGKNPPEQLPSESASKTTNTAFIAADPRLKFIPTPGLPAIRTRKLRPAFRNGFPLLITHHRPRGSDAAWKMLLAELPNRRFRLRVLRCFFDMRSRVKAHAAMGHASQTPAIRGAMIESQRQPIVRLLGTIPGVSWTARLLVWLPPPILLRRLTS